MIYAYRAHGGKNNACPSNFCYELVLVLSEVPLKRWIAELHIDTKNKAKRDELACKGDGSFFIPVWLIPCLNLEQICNSQKNIIALSLWVGKYQRYDQQKSQVYLAHSASVVAYRISKILSPVLIFLVVPWVFFKIGPHTLQWRIQDLAKGGACAKNFAWPRPSQAMRMVCYLVCYNKKLHWTVVVLKL